jgi:choline-glycine betaine transporter
MTTGDTGAADVIPKADGSGRRIDPVVFYVGAGLVLAFVLWGALATGGLDSATASALDWVLRSFGWVFVVAAIVFLTFSLYLGTSRYGRLRLGADDERPEFRTMSWIAMMFSAGMGIGLMFYGEAEPISHLAAPPLGLAEPGSERAASCRCSTRSSTGR